MSAAASRAEEAGAVAVASSSSALPTGADKKTMAVIREDPDAKEGCETIYVAYGAKARFTIQTASGPNVSYLYAAHVFTLHVKRGDAKERAFALADLYRHTENFFFTCMRNSEEIKAKIKEINQAEATAIARFGQSEAAASVLNMQRAFTVDMVNVFPLGF